MLSYEVEISKKFNTFYLYTGPTSLILGMSSSVLGAFCISSLINGHTIVRDILHAPIAGGIITGSASFFIVSPVYSLVVGFSGGAIQAFIQNIIEKRWLKKKPVISTISWSLFGVQGIIGGIFSTGYKRIIES
jgi:ammonia channel protein AmtB